MMEEKGLLEEWEAWPPRWCNIVMQWRSPVTKISAFRIQKGNKSQTIVMRNIPPAFPIIPIFPVACLFSVWGTTWCQVTSLVRTFAPPSSEVFHWFEFLHNLIFLFPLASFSRAIRFPFAPIEGATVAGSR
jgi:hypothetical protein